MSRSTRADRRRGMETTTSARLSGLGEPKTILLTTFRHNGEGVATPVSAVWDGNRGWFRTWDAAGKIARMRRDSHVTVAPCTVHGRVTGPTVDARVRVLADAEAADARHRLATRFPVLHGVVVPLTHRLKGWTTVHVELTDPT